MALDPPTNERTKNCTALKRAQSKSGLDAEATTLGAVWTQVHASPHVGFVLSATEVDHGATGARAGKVM